MNGSIYSAEVLHYYLETIRLKNNDDPKKCCQELFRDRLMTSLGGKADPKVWLTLLNVLTITVL